MNNTYEIKEVKKGLFILLINGEQFGEDSYSMQTLGRRAAAQGANPGAIFFTLMKGK